MKYLQACDVCKKDMEVAEGQVAYYHGTCRKWRNNKRGYRMSVATKQHETRN